MLHYAVKSSSLDYIKILIAKNANIYAVTKDGSGVLHFMMKAKKFDINILKLLLATGAISDVYDKVL